MELKGKMKTSKRLILLLSLGAVLAHIKCFSKYDNNGGWEELKKRVSVLEGLRPLVLSKVMREKFPDLKSFKFELRLQRNINNLKPLHNKEIKRLEGKFNNLKGRMPNLLGKILPSVDVKDQARAFAKINKEIKETIKDLDVITKNMVNDIVEENKPVWVQLKVYGEAVLEDLKRLKKMI